MLVEPPRLGEEGVPVSDRRGILREVLVLYFGTLLAIKAVVVLQASLKLPADLLALVPALFIYVPILWLQRRGRDGEDFGLSLVLPVLRGRGREGLREDLAEVKIEWRRALGLNLALAAIIVPPFVVGNHLFQKVVFGRSPVGLLPHHFVTEVVFYHLFFVAIPEEFFYRGYVQTRLNEVFPRPFRILGVRFGWGLVLTAVLFTLGHSIVVLRWWHFSILFPALAFGVIRERTGNILSGALFHAFCNILMVTLDTWYGVIKP